MCPAQQERPRVLLTRPAGRNDDLAKQLEAANYDVIERPLLKIAGLPLDTQKKQLLMDPDLFDDVVFVSGNAVEYGIPLLQRYWPRWPLSLRWFAVGPATALRLRALLDVEVMFPERGASNALLERPEFQSVTGRRILIVRGHGGRELLADTLLKRGADVQYLEVYERRPVDYDGGFVRELEQADIGCVVISSGESLVQFARFVEASEFRGTLLVPSGRVASMAIALGFAKVRIIEAMTDAAIARAIFAAAD